MKRGNEPAFPRPYSEEQPGDRKEFAYSQQGMTLREWYAGQVMAGFAAAPVHELPADSNGELSLKQTAKVAVDWADALLAALAAPK